MPLAAFVISASALQFSNFRISFGKSVLITMRFKVPEPEKHNDKLMHLLSNCCIGCPGRPGPTIDIALLTDSTGGIIVLSTYSSASGEKFIFIPYFNTVRCLNISRKHGINVNDYNHKAQPSGGTGR